MEAPHPAMHCGDPGERPIEPGPARVAAQSSALIGAELASKGQWPWVGRLSLNGSHHCGAVLISPDWLLTATHCIQRAQGQELKAVFGDFELGTSDEDEQWFDLVETVIHPDFNTLDGVVDDHDVALARLSVSAETTNSVGVADIETCQRPETVWLAGWGDRGLGPERATEALETVAISVASDDVCRAHLDELGAAEQARDTLCGGGKLGEPGACHKDSGDPAMFQAANGDWKLAGIVAAGGPDCDEYTLIERLDRYREWIDITIEL